MKITVEYIKDNYLIFTIKISIIGFFILSLVYGISKLINHYDIVGDNDAHKLTQLFQISTKNSYLRPALISLIPMIAVLRNNKIDWLLIQSYFYFLIANLVFSATYIDLKDIALVIVNVIGFLFIMLFILLMNKNKISNLVYGIKKSELIKINMIASVIGIAITIILALIKGY